MRARSIALTLLLCGCAHQPRPADPTQNIPSPPVAGAAADEAPRAPAYVVRFGLGETNLSPESKEVLRRAAEAYADGPVSVTIVSLGGSADSFLMERRIDAVQAWLRDEATIWARPVERKPDGDFDIWPEIGQIRGVEVTLVLGPPPSRPTIPPPDPPVPDPPPSGVPSRPDRPPRPAPIATAAPLLAGAGPASAASGLRAFRNWLTPTRTLTRDALGLLVGECVRVRDELTAECGEAAVGGDAAFGQVPGDALREFAYLTRNCRGQMTGNACLQAAAVEREFRAFPRGELKPAPLEMTEGERTRFKAPLVDSGERRGEAGRAIDAPEAAGATGSRPAPIIVPYSAEMCFTLEADPGDFRIEPPASVCQKQQSTGGATVYRPEWWVTPLRSGDLGLRLKTELFVGGTKREFPHNPYPLPIKVEAKPSGWDWFDSILDRATATVNRATGLVKAVGALIGALGLLGIWKWFRGRKAKKGSARPARPRRKKEAGDSA